MSNIFTSIFHWFANLFNGFNKEKVGQIIDDVHHFADAAMPAVELVIKLTPTSTDDVILAGLKTIGLTAEDVVNQVIDAYRHGAKMDLAVAIFKDLLKDKVEKDGHIQIGATLLKTAEDVLHLDDAMLRTAVNLAYKIFTGGK